MISLNYRTAQLYERLTMYWTVDFDYEQYQVTFRHHVCTGYRAVQNKENGNRVKCQEHEAYIYLCLIPKFTFIIPISIHYLILLHLTALQIGEVNNKIHGISLYSRCFHQCYQLIPMFCTH
jgi:hypothetical protein